MLDTITSCVEEEYSLFLSYLWRNRTGWRPLFMYFRGPAGVPFFLAPILTFMGLWRFARQPLRLADVAPEIFQNATVISTSYHLGSYGMGGPGFVGLRLRLSRLRSIWVVFTIWGAAGWLTINHDLLEEGYFPDERRELTGIRKFRPLSDLVGSTLTDVQLEYDDAELTFNGTSSPLVLRLQRDSSALPVHRGSKRPKVLALSQDIRDAVVISRRASLWLNN
jgi:hypothetical protein